MKKIANDGIIAGIIETDKENIVFCAENFKFIFMRANFSRESIVIPIDENGYIWGRTYSGKTIAIYARENVELRNTRVLNTFNYIVSKNVIPKEYMQNFKGIRFKNGVIKTIYPCNASHQDMENNSTGTLIYHIEKDCMEYQFQHEKQSTTWRFYSIVQQSMSREEGDSLSNSDAVLDVIFKEKQRYNTFRDFYGYVSNVCSFLVFRERVSYEKVYLLRENGYVDYDIYAECYIKNPNIVPQRDVSDIIPIRYVDDTVFNNILLNILRVDKKHKGLPLFIAPKDDMGAKVMDIGRIRNICSTMEMELDLGGIRLEENPKMKKLVDSVKTIIKEHREGEEKLPDRVYDNIGRNLSHWSQPVAVRMYQAWKQHEATLVHLLKRYSLEVTEESIFKFVKARNDITHEGFSEISEEVKDTAFALLGLIYCCTLTRLGVKTEIIEDILSKKLFE